MTAPVSLYRSLLCSVLMLALPSIAAALGWIDPGTRPGLVRPAAWRVARVATSIRATVEGRVARIEVEAPFHNDGSIAEGTYRDPMSGEAVFHPLSLWMGETEMRGELTLDTARASPGARVADGGTNIEGSTPARIEKIIDSSWHRDRVHGASGAGADGCVRAHTGRRQPAASRAKRHGPACSTRCGGAARERPDRPWRVPGGAGGCRLCQRQVGQRGAQAQRTRAGMCGIVESSSTRARVIGGPRFAQHGTGWRDISQHAQRIVTVEAFSPAYFAVLKALPEARDATALGDDVLGDDVLGAGQRVSVRNHRTGQATMAGSDVMQLAKSFRGA